MLLVCHLEVGDIERPRSTTGFDKHLGFVHLTHFHAERFPFLEVSRDVDMATGTSTLTHAEELRESLIPLNGGLVYTSVLPNFVSITVNREFTVRIFFISLTQFA